MSKPFSQIKSTLLGPEDILTFGKYKGCRICDILNDNYEYLIFLEKEGYVKYNRYLTEKIQQVAGFELEKVHYAEEIAPYLLADWDEDDIPF